MRTKDEQAMANRENKLNEAASSPRDGAGVRDDRVRRLGRSAGDAKDASPFGQAAPPDVRALKPGGREAEVKVHLIDRVTVHLGDEHRMHQMAGWRMHQSRVRRHATIARQESMLCCLWKGRTIARGNTRSSCESPSRIAYRHRTAVGAGFCLDLLRRDAV
jgi:hypothetical protein